MVGELPGVVRRYGCMMCQNERTTRSLCGRLVRHATGSSRRYLHGCGGELVLGCRHDIDEAPV
ncbi:unnamed protein product [Ectocarpus sp. CCAP 1310/34]|nr:unnamed protein product [Ectocarpus sp. CCAP 1310/34]